MATLSSSKGGLRTIQFVNAAGDRKTIRLGRMNRAAAEAIRGHVAHLVVAAVTRSAPPMATAVWLAEVGEPLHEKLVGHGLAAPRQADASAQAQLAPFLDGYIARRSDLKEQTVKNLTQVRNGLVKFFGKARDLRTINRGEAKDWHRGLLSRLARATVSMHVKKARQFFVDAVDRKLIAESPFDAVRSGGERNRKRQHNVGRADADRILAACPDAEWRLIFALARFGGLRTPSETYQLRWRDVDFARGRMTVRSPKTERHEGGESREVPIFPELLPYLQDALAVAEEGAVYCVATHRNVNLRTRALKIIGRAGVAAYPKPFQNLRSTRQTELEERFPSHVVCAWMGNSEKVAREHYLQVTDEHFSQATKGKPVATPATAAGGSGCEDGQECSVTPEHATAKSAAKSAADTPGQGRTGPDQKHQNPQKTEGLVSVQYPQGESNKRGKQRGKRKSTRGALRKALHTIDRETRRMFRRERGRR